ncbi:MAG TPA: tetratricopeptide repeat protein, partial [Pirellulaceae bacterium]|nr:tetratricopeptide repeat protein [Pirellulaceae bacterium]
DWPEALNLLGVLRHQQGRSDAGIELIKLAIERQPDFPSAYQNLASVLLATGRAVDALATVRGGLKLRPDSAELLRILARALVAAGRHAEALDTLRRVVQLDPADAASRAALNALAAQIESAAKPKNKSNSPAGSTTPPRATTPNGATTPTVSMTSVGSMPPVSPAASASPPTRIAPSNSNPPANTTEPSRSTLATGSIQWFSTWFEQFLRRAEQGGDARIHASVQRLRDAVLAWEAGRYEESRRLSRESETIAPEFELTQLWLALDALLAGRFDEARRRAASGRAAPVCGQYIDAVVRLSLGESGDAWREFESVVLRGANRTYGPCVPLWDGRPVPGETLLVATEPPDGFGDVFNFVGLASHVAAQGMRVLLATKKLLHPLLSRTPGLAGFVDVDALSRGAAERPRFDRFATLFSLPRLLANSVDELPRVERYLVSDPARVERWRREFESRGWMQRGVVRVGLSWFGSRPHASDNRPMPLQELARLGAIDGVEWISLQKGAAADELSAWNASRPLNTLGDQFDSASGAFVDTAAVMELLDVVICCDTSIAHLAGGMGKRVWVGLPYAADFRWLVGRDDSPWYPSARLFRQPAPGDWRGAIDHLDEALRKLVGDSEATGER